MDKKLKSLIICLIILIIGIICYFAFSFIFFDNIRFKKEYEKFNDNYININIDEDNNIKYVDVNEALDILNTGSGILYIGEPKSNKCRVVLPIFLDVVKEEEVDNIYYLNASNIRDIKKKGSSEYDKLLNMLNKYLSDYKGIDDESKRIYFPSFVFIMGGKVVGFYNNDIYDKVLNAQEKSKIKKIYKENIDKMYGMCDESC